jgi:allantoinase
MKLAHHERYDYSPIIDRPDFSWPGGRRLAFYLALNVEHFEFGGRHGHTPTALGPPPDPRNYAWRDYGLRVGIWRIFDLAEQLGLPLCHLINSTVSERYPQIVARIAARGDEIVGHGRTNSERQADLDEAGEAALIREATTTLAQIHGAPPAGWMGPWISESQVTPDLLKEAGYSYLLDWPADDQPFWMRTRSGPILSIPYPVEINDSPALVFRRHSGREFAEMIIDQFDELLHQSKKRPLVCPIALHPFIIGQPFRLRAFRRALDHILAHRKELWITTPGEISRYCAALPKGIVPGS